MFLISTDDIHRDNPKSIAVEAKSFELGICLGCFIWHELYVVTIFFHVIDLILEIIAVLLVLWYRLPVQVHIPISVILSDLETTNISFWWRTWY